MAPKAIRAAPGIAAGNPLTGPAAPDKEKGAVAPFSRNRLAKSPASGFALRQGWTERVLHPDCAGDTEVAPEFFRAKALHCALQRFQAAF